MSNSPLSPVFVRLHVMIVTALLLTTSTLVHSRGLSGLDDPCGSCYMEIGLTFVKMVTGQSNTESRSNVDLQPEAQDRISGLVALLMGTEGRESRENLECSTCWVIAHRLKKRAGFPQGLGGVYESSRKRAMLNNGWE